MSNSSSSVRGLFTLLSGVSEDVLERELRHNLPKLLDGILWKKSSSEKSAKNRNVSSNFKKFLDKLAIFLDKNEDETLDILSSYLSGDFRGTRDSLKALIDQERLQTPLIRDIWQFYRSERLYLLQVLKTILSNQGNESHEHFIVFSKIVSEMSKDGKLKNSLIFQLEAVFKENDKNNSQEAWTNYNLREQVELLQMLLLYYHMSNEKELKTCDDLIKLLEMFQYHEFGQKYQNMKVNQNLAESIGPLQSLLIVYLMDLPKFTLLTEERPLWIQSSSVDSILCSLGSLSDHGPIMLVWMLINYLQSNGDILPKHVSLGERAVQLRVLHYLNSSLANDVISANSTIKSIASGIVYSIVSVLITVFDPDKTGLGMDIHVSSNLVLKEALIASDFWKQGFETGLGFVLGGYLTKFPETIKPVLELCASLAGASEKSAKEVVSMLQNLNIYTEPMENCSNETVIAMSNDKWISRVDRYLSNSVYIPSGSKAYCDGQYFQWKTKLNAWQLFLSEIDICLKQVSAGFKNVSVGTLHNVTGIVLLVDNILRSSPSSYSLLEQLPCSFYTLIEKFVIVPHPPIHLLSSCVSVLSLISKSNPGGVWTKLLSSRLFPMAVGSDQGIVGALLAQQECVDGEYPLTGAFLDLLANCATVDNDILPSVLFVIREILPSFQQWRFTAIAGKQIFGQKILKVCQSIIVRDAHSLKDTVCNALLNPAPCETLLNLVATGDKTIQFLMETQSNWENGKGIELSKLVNMALNILDLLIMYRQDSHELSRVLCSPVTLDHQPHFLLIIAHYVYHFQNTKIPISAIKLLTVVAGVFPMSLLACLGTEAEAFRDILILRLESITEDVILKIAIINFFSACVESQPGLVQLLIGIKSSHKIGEQESKLNNGCLKSILNILENQIKDNEDLSLAVMNFIQKLWSHQRIVAVSYLKEQKNFWKHLMASLFISSSSDLSSKTQRLATSVFQIVSSEIFAFGGKVDESLQSLLKTFVSEEFFSLWSHHVLSHHDPLLLSAWKNFIVLLCKDEPVSLGPKICQFIVKDFVSTIRDQLSEFNVTASLCETTLILLKTWNKKCCSEFSIKEQMGILEDTSMAYKSLNYRTKASILAISHTLFKNNKMDKILVLLQPVASLTVLSVNEIPEMLSYDCKFKIGLQVPILAISLLCNLIQHCTRPEEWLPIWREYSLTQCLLCVVHHCLRMQKSPDIVTSILNLLLHVSKTEEGSHGLLVSDLPQLFWLPLSAIRDPFKEWFSVFELSFQFIRTLLIIAKKHAVDDAITVAALLQDQISSIMLAPKIKVTDKNINLTASASSFISLLFCHHRQWQIQQANSLHHFYVVMNSMVHICVCLLIRPSMLGTMVDQTLIHDYKRVRRLSSTDGELEQVSPATVAVQNKLLDVVSSGLSMLRALSPQLVSLITGDMLDPDQWQPLLHIAFSSPTFEQEVSDGLTYGTLISISNFCIRSITRSDKTPSPHKNNSKFFGTPDLDRKRLLLVFEQSVAVTLSQSLLCLQNNNINQRDKQLLRRECGAELGSFVESMRKFLQRNSKSPATSKHDSILNSTKILESSEKFIKLVSIIVRDVYK